jgi:hypothetical protein
MVIKCLNKLLLRRFSSQPTGNVSSIVIHAFDSTGGEYNWPGELGVQYADKMGIIHNLTFGPNHAKILLDIQPEGGQIGG